MGCTGVDMVNGQRHFKSFQVACVYIGTVVGAGFASGREIYQFFVRFGNLGYIAILLTTLMFAWFGFQMMNLGRILSAKSYRDVNAFLFGRWFSHIVDTLSLLMLFGVTVAMLAGAGELFKERLGIQFMVGVVVTVVIAFFTLMRGITGILESNTIIVPIMIGFVVYAFMHTISHVGLPKAMISSTNLSHATSIVPMLVSAVIYSALNIGLSASVLIPLGAQINDEMVLKRGAMMGAAGLGCMLVFVAFTLFAYAPDVFTFEVPMGYVASKLGSVIQWGYVFVLWGEIFSTLVGNVYGLSSQMTGRSQSLMTLYTGSLLFIAVLCSQIGFSNLVAYGYTIFGWVSLLLLFALCLPRKNLHKD
jgi:uncharacterized membrane protein YkvI